MCLYPRLIKNRRFIPNKKNNGTPPMPEDNRMNIVPIGCGVCIECRKKKVSSWRIRLMEELRFNKHAHFVTLTFKPEELERFNNEAPVGLSQNDKLNWIAARATRLFCNNWRKEFKKSIRHWFIPELGHKGTERLHIHGIIWHNSKDDIRRKWIYGWSYIGYSMNEAVINYVVKYVTKVDTQHKWFMPKILCSPGIGSNFMSSDRSKFNNFKGSDTNDKYVLSNGYRVALPMYYRLKLYSDKERGQLWIQALNKGERWVMGEKLTSNNSHDELIKLLKYYRTVNQRLGYLEPKYDDKNYIEQLAELKKDCFLSNSKNHSTWKQHSTSNASTEEHTQLEPCTTKQSIYVTQSKTYQFQKEDTDWPSRFLQSLEGNSHSWKELNTATGFESTQVTKSLTQRAALFPEYEQTMMRF